MPFVVASICQEGSSTPVKDWFACSVIVDVTLADFFTEYSNGEFAGDAVHDDQRVVFEKVLVGKSKADSDMTKVAPSTRILDAVGSLGPFVKFMLAKEVEERPAPAASGASITGPSALDVLMSSTKSTRARCLPQKFPQTQQSGKGKLKNSVLDWLSFRMLGWTSDNCTRLGLAFVNTLADALWYIDRNQDTFHKRGFSVPTLFDRFSGSRCPEKSKKRKIDESFLTVDGLKAHGESLYNLALASYMKQDRWENVHSAICSLADSMMKYRLYLASQSKRVSTTWYRVTCLFCFCQSWDGRDFPSY